MDNDKIIEHYRAFKKLIKLFNYDESNKEGITTFNNLLANNFLDIIEGLVFYRFYNNTIGKERASKQIISFLVSELSITKTLMPSSLLTHIREVLTSKMQDALSDIPLFNENTYKTSCLFKKKISTEPYGDDPIYYLFYYDHNNSEIYNNYVMLYKEYLIKRLETLYTNPNLNRQINLDNMQICSLDNFSPTNITDEIAFANRDKLINKLISGITEKRRLLSPDDVLLCHKAKIIHDMISYSTKSMDIEYNNEHQRSVPIVSLENDNEKELKLDIVRLLRGSMRQRQYSGFFTKDDYVSFLNKKYSSFKKEDIEWFFDNVTKPRPPIGVTRFSVNVPGNDKIVYFVSLDNVATLFSNYNFLGKRERKSMLLSISERHFILFLKKLLSDFRKLGYTDDVISNKLNCTTSTIKLMDKTIASL